MRALVTGCAGFIGSHLTERLLSDGYDVTGIDCFTDYYSRTIKERNLARACQSERFAFLEGDLCELSEFPPVDYVFHMAAQPGVRASWGKNFEVYVRNNVEATQRLLEFYATEHLEKFVYSSSSSVYGDAEVPMREDARPQPVSPYGVTKLAAEHLSYLYWKNYGVPTVSLRYFTVYGPRQRPDMAIHRFIRAILEHRPVVVFGDGTQRRDFTYISDVVSALVMAATSPLAGEVFNIGGGITISVNALLEKIETLTGIRARIMYEAPQKGDVEETLADTSRARHLLRWKPRVDVDSGLTTCVKACQRDTPQG